MKPNKAMRKAIAEWRSTQSNADQKCLACNGTGRYDVQGSPKCGACGGTGKRQPAPGKS